MISLGQVRGCVLRSNNFQGHALCVAIALIGAAYATSVDAKCFKPDPNVPPITLDISEGPIYVPPGNIGWPGFFRWGHFPVALPGGCLQSESIFARYKAPVSAFDRFIGIFHTNLPGIGIRISESANGLGVREYSDVFANQWKPSEPANSVEVLLYKIADDVAPGRLFPAGTVVASRWYDGDGPSNPVINIVMGGLGTSVMPTTCDVAVNSRNIVVDFGAISRTEFTGVGSRAQSRDFAIDVECSSISSVYNTVGLRVDGFPDPSNLPGVLALTPGSDTAQGVGIELVRTSGGVEQPMPLAEFVEVGKAGADKTRLSIPLRARYIQVEAGQVKPGKANGMATFTIEYK